MTTKKFQSASDAARYAATINNQWADATGKLMNANDLLGLMSAADEANGLDADDEKSYYLVDENGSVGLTYDAEASVFWVANATGQPQKPETQPESPKFCAECGEPLNPGQKFCAKCGSKVNVQPAEVAPVVAPEEVTEEKSVPSDENESAEAVTEVEPSTEAETAPEAQAETENKAETVEKQGEVVSNESVKAEITACDADKNKSNKLADAKNMLKGNKKLLLMLIAAGALLAVWAAVWIAEAICKKNPVPFVFRVLAFLTFADGGISKSIFYIIGGWLGKALFLATLLAMVTGGYKKLGQGFSSILNNVKKAKDFSVLSALLFGMGGGAILFNFFTGRVALSLSVIGIAGTVFMLWILGGGLQEVSFANKLSAKLPENANIIFSGAAVGFLLPVLLSFVSWGLSLLGFTRWGFMPYCLGALCIIGGGVLTIITTQKKAGAKTEENKGAKTGGKTIVAIIAVVLAVIMLVMLPIFTFAESKAAQEPVNLFVNGLVAVSIDDKYGFINEKGKFVISTQFDDASNFTKNGLARVQVGDKWCYINKKGKFVITAQFDNARDFTEEGTAFVSAGGKWGVINKKGKYIVYPQFDSLLAFAENGLAAARIGDKWGYIDKKGKTVIDFQFSGVGSFGENGLARAQIDGKWGYINKKGKFVIPAQFETSNNFDESGLAIVRINKQYGFINEKGKFVVNAQFDAVRAFAENGLAAVRVGDNWGYINKKGKYVINLQFENARTFAENGLAIVTSNGKMGYINKNGKFVVNAQFDNAWDFDEKGLALVRSGDKYGFINKKGDYVINPQYDKVDGFFENGLAVVRADGKYGIINRKGKYVVPLIYKWIDEEFSNGLIVFTDDNDKDGYMNEKGKIVISPKFDNASDFFDDGYAIVRVGKNYGIINKKGDYIINPQLDDVV